jgi:transposase-like protein
MRSFPSYLESNMPQRRLTPHQSSAERVKVLTDVENLLRKMRLTEACQKCGIKRSTYYNWKKKASQGGEAALEPKVVDRKAVGQKHPHKKGELVLDALLKARIEHPGMSIRGLVMKVNNDQRSQKAKDKISEKTALKYLEKANLKCEAALYDAIVSVIRHDKTKKLSKEQMVFLTKTNPARGDLKNKALAPGQVIVVRIYYLGTTMGGGRVWASVVIDMHSFKVWGELHLGRQERALITLVCEVRDAVELCSNKIGKIIDRNPAGRMSKTNPLKDVCGNVASCPYVPGKNIDGRFERELKDFWEKRSQKNTGIARQNAGFQKFLKRRNKEESRWFPANGDAPDERWGQNTCEPEIREPERRERPIKSLARRLSQKLVTTQAKPSSNRTNRERRRK